MLGRLVNSVLYKVLNTSFKPETAGQPGALSPPASLTCAVDTWVGNPQNELPCSPNAQRITKHRYADGDMTCGYCS